MENNNIYPAHKVKIKVSLLLNKFNHKEDRINFCRERSILFHIIYYKISYFRNEGLLTKKFLISLIKGKPKYIDYLPDNSKIDNISKDFLFCVRTFFNS